MDPFTVVLDMSLEEGIPERKVGWGGVSRLAASEGEDRLLIYGTHRYDQGQNAVQGACQRASIRDAQG